MRKDPSTNTLQEAPSAAAPDNSAGGRPRPTGGLRARALLVAIPLLLGISFISLYADIVTEKVQLGVLQLAPPAVAALFVLVLSNRALTRLLKRELLNSADLLVIYTMLLVGVLVSTRGVIEKLIPPLAYLPYYATRENQLNERITQHLPAWALPFTPSSTAGTVPPAIRGFYEGNGGIVPWSAWLQSMIVWLGLVLCVIFVFACLATLLRRQWMDNEQLRFPLTTLPLAMIRDEAEGQPFWTSRLMWSGFAVAVVIYGVNGMQANYPDWPGFVLNLNLSPYFTERPWNQMDALGLGISLAAIGFAYILPTDLLFSLWFFFLMTRAQDVVAVQLGGMPTNIGTHDTRIWTGYQAAGAYVVLVLAQLRIGWPYYKQVWRTAFARDQESKPLDDSEEIMSYRTALIGLCLGFAGIILWLTLAGMSPIVAVAQMGIYVFLIILVTSRGVCEAGLLILDTSFLPTHLIALVTPLPQLGASNLSLLGLTNAVFVRDPRGALLSTFLDSQKMAGELRVRQRSLLLPLAIAVIFTLIAATYFFLKLHYTHGGLSLMGYLTYNPKNMYGLASATIQDQAPAVDSTAYGGFGVGLVVTGVLVWMRSSFLWFPLHPLAYALAPTWGMKVLWFSIFIAWTVKSLVLRFGGIQIYRQLVPLMFGLILGEFVMKVVWAFLSTSLFGFSAPQFPV